ncbi:hypothetical protein NM688_g8947 [Phlebia brevispora]|uniref:Uncharacterized protein n=1 Tax=Phlebia brevispora TaxID=194682 RepID=A0ACC1RL83_9APHY|nr:hypothetical protein NM688_g8947 [Phlebia brevispora]
MTPFPKIAQTDRTEDYEYFSDSDLDEEEEDVEFDDARSIWDFNASEADQVMSPEVANQCANSTLEDAASSATATTSNSVAPLEKLRINVENRNAGQLVRGRGRVIVLPDISFNTLQSLVYYLYTGEVSFANLKSQSQSSLFYHCIVPPPGSEPFAYRAPLCSPKSMYRVADKYGLDELKQKAADDIKTKLCAENIFQELFSTVTSTHDEIRSWQVAFACDKNIYETMAMNISPWISRVATGELAHCEPVVSDLIKQMAQNMKSASTPSPSEGKPKGKPRSGKQQDGPIGPWEHPELA